MAWITLRSIVEENSVRQDAERFKAQFQRFDEAWDALKWLLSREPDQKNAARHSGGQASVYVQAADGLAKTPEIWVVYRYDDNEVVLLGVNAVEGSSKDDE